MSKSVIADMSAHMDKTIESLRREYQKVRTGRASTGLLEEIKVDYYGTPSPLSAVATLAVPEPRTITLQPWESKMIPVIEKAIMNANLGLTPANDGKLIRLNLPPLFGERGEIEADHLAVVGGSEPQVRVHDRLLDDRDHFGFPRLQGDRARLGDRQRRHLTQGRRRAVIVDPNVVQQPGAGPAGADFLVFAAECIDGLVHVALHIPDDVFRHIILLSRWCRFPRQKPPA